MRSIITELWDGTLAPQENLLVYNKEVSDACERSEIIRERIENALLESDKSLLDQYDDLTLTISEASEEEAFRRGVTVGIKLMMEVMSYDDV